MGLVSSATINIAVEHINKPPYPACEDGSSGLFLSENLWTTLRAVSQGEAAANNGTNVLLFAEIEAATGSDAQRELPRTQALDRLVRLAANGAIVFGPSAWPLACSASGAKQTRMVSDLVQESLNMSLLAFDGDQDASITYTLLDVPTEGTLYATTALPSAIYPKVGAFWSLIGFIDCICLWCP